MSDVLDLLVGGISVVLGIVCLLASLVPIAWFYQLPKAQWVSRHWGAGAARAFYGILGLALVIWGAVIASGWKLMTAS